MQINQVGYGDPDASKLISEVQQEYVVRYGGPDGTPVDPAEFTPPSGLFLIGYLDGVPVACGGWRSHGDDVEIKRMYVVPAARHRGLARQLLAELERSAAAAGHHRIILESGSAQPEAIALYRSSGYTPIAPFGYYADARGAIHLGKTLPGR
ncbi:MAG TPA: GNAT family N-acetyltransferase [Streptosporangiaceae bacterium]|nr:GNAT family N-acetyltransferase [Streptosporangiaceae bacterium]